MRRTVLITGASRGIGRSIAERLLADGHQLSLGLRDPAVLSGTVLDHADVHRHVYDADDPASATALVAATAARCDGVDAVIHCAGILHRTPLLFQDGEEIALEQLWRTNLMGPWWLTRAAWPQLAAHGEGRLQVLVSMSGKRSKGRLASYTASKFALLGLCQTMRNEGWEAGIRVTAICPGWVNTDMAAAVQAIPAEAMTQPQDIAALSAELLRLPNSAVPFELAINCTLER